MEFKFWTHVKIHPTNGVSILQDLNVNNGELRIRENMRKSKKQQKQKLAEQLKDFDYKLEMRRAKDGSLKEESEEKVLDFNNFPVDLWFLVSEHIRPEDVKTFGLICQKTAYVLTTAKFWLLLYKKYYNEDLEGLPQRLQPDCVICKIGGLRTNVIKSLFYLYPTFSSRRTLENRDDYDIALRKIVVSMNCRKSSEKNLWTYHFKLKNRTEVSHKYTALEKKLSVKEEKLNRNIFYNKDEGCQLLEVISVKYVPLPRFQDEIPCIKSIIKTLSTDFRNYKLKILFSNYSGNEVLGDPMHFDPVMSIRLLDWWHPDFDELLK